MGVFYPGSFLEAASSSPPTFASLRLCVRFCLLRTASAAALPLSTTINAIIHRTPKMAVADWPRNPNSEKTRSNQPIAPVELTIRNFVVGYFNKPETTSSAVRVPSTKRLKISANPPYRSNQRDARSILRTGSKRCAQRDSKSRFPRISR